MVVMMELSSVTAHWPLVWDKGSVCVSPGGTITGKLKHKTCKGKKRGSIIFYSMTTMV